ncbi:MAG: beta strand repeat-containing protein, partial [Planctomyces sp.]
QTDADITTTNDNITLVSATTLTGAVAISTGSGAGTIAFNNTLDGGHSLTLTSGTGNIDFDAPVGSIASLGILTVVSAMNVTADSSVTAASILQQAGSGATTFTGAVTTNTVAGVNLTGTDLVVTTGISTASNGVLTTRLSGSATLSNGSVTNITGTTTIDADGAIIAGGSTTSAGQILLRSTTNSITINSAASMNSATQNVTLEAEDNITVSSTSIVTTTLGEVILRSGVGDTDNSGSMLLNGIIQALAAGQFITLDLNQQQGATQSATGALIASNLRLISTGSANGSFALGTSTLNDVDTLAAKTSGAVTFRDLDTLTVGSISGSPGIAPMAGITTYTGVPDSAPVSITTGGNLTINQAIDTLAGSASSIGTVTLNSAGNMVLNGAGNITADGAVQLTATNGIQTDADITTTNDNITLVSATTLTGAVAISTGSGAGTIAFNNTLDGGH